MVVPYTTGLAGIRTHAAGITGVAGMTGGTQTTGEPPMTDVSRTSMYLQGLLVDC